MARNATYQKTVEFGKIKAYCKTRRCSANVTIEIRTLDGPQQDIDLGSCAHPVELAICGEVWNGNGTDLIYGGQCIDTMLQEPELKHNAKLQRIAKVWQRWHLNAMQAGTRRQRRALHLCKVLEIDTGDYTRRCDLLHRIGLLYDNGYKYGSAWLVEPLPDDIIAEVKSW